MTNFDDRYRLLKCVALGGGMRTHNAQEKTTGRPVMVHIVDAPDPDIVERLREQVHALPPPERSRIVEMAETPNGFAIVSEFLPGLTTFPEWLAARAPPGSGSYGRDSGSGRGPCFDAGRTCGAHGPSVASNGADGGPRRGCAGADAELRDRSHRIFPRRASPRRPAARRVHAAVRGDAW